MLFRDNPIDRLDDPASRARESLLASNDREQVSHDGQGDLTEHHAEGGAAAKRKPNSSSAPVEEQDSKYIPKNLLEKTGVFETGDDDFDERSASIFEPRNLEQKLTALWQNTFEVCFLLILFMVARFHPNFISLTFVAFSSNMVLPIAMNNLSRILWGRVLNIINCVVIGCAIYYKYSQPENQSYGNKEEAQKNYDWHKSVGFKIKQLNGPVENGGKFEYTLLHQEVSLDFEWAALMITLLAFSQYQFMDFSIKKLSQKKYKQEVILLQNYELSLMYQTNEPVKVSEDESTVVELTEAQKEQKKLDELMKKNYQKEMKQLSERFPKNFLDCRWFQLWSKNFFVTTLVCQLIQSMGYNGLYDIPALLIILGLFAFYTFRKSMPHTHLIFLMVSIYYISFAIWVKWLYLIFIQVPMVNQYAMDNRESKTIQIFQALFGKRLKFDGEGLKRGQSTTKTVEGISFQLSILGTFYFSMIYQSAKWCRIREQTQILHESTSAWQRLKFYVMYKDKISTKDQRVEQLLQQSREHIGGSNLLAKQTEKIAKRFKALNKNLMGKFSNDMNKYLPTICIWALRIGLGFQAYMYHSTLGLFHLCFVLFTFLSNTRFSLMVAIYIMLPIYFLEFIIVYAMKIEAVNNYKLFQVTKKVFLEKLQFPILEQVLYFVILAFMVLSISCLKLCFMSQDFGYIASSRDAMVELLTKKVCEKDTWIIWKALFQLARFSHVIALAYLYILSQRDLDNMRALTFMIFFTFYSASETLYRKTKWILSFYLCYLIYNEYYYTLILQKQKFTDLQMHVLKWYNLVPQDSDSFKPSKSIYFRHKADSFNWDVLILMCMLDTINKIFLDTKLAKEIEERSWKILMDSYPETLKFLTRARNLLSTYLTLIMCGIIVYCISKGETTLINWIYFSLNVLLLCFLSNNDKKKGTLTHSLRIANCIVLYSAILLIGECIFAWIFGVRANNIEGSNNMWLQKNYPIFYQGLQLIGLRMYVGPQQVDTNKEHLQFFSIKCTSYIIYLVIGLYFSRKFSKELETSKDLENVDEDDFKRIFEFKNEHQFDKSKQADANNIDLANQNETKNGLGESFVYGQSSIYDTNTAQGAGMYSNQIIQKIKNKKARINKDDFEMFYIMFQYDPGFQAYKVMKWWPALDFLATYGHFATNLVTVIISTCYVVNVYTMLNLCLICYLYVRGTIRISIAAFEYLQQSGIQSQIDCKMASLVSKNYQRAAHFEFGKVRKMVWRCQLILLVIICILGYPTTLLSQTRKKLAHRHENTEYVKLIDQITFWAFMTGIWKDPRFDVMWSFYGVVIVIFICLYLERNFITWLYTRDGCTYNRFQKYTELEIRRECLMEDCWEKKQPPRYHPERYRNHYYEQDFDKLLDRFRETDEQARKEFKEQKKKGVREIRNFIPYKVAVRIKEAIRFSVMLDGRSPDLNIDDNTRTLLNKWDDYCYDEENPYTSLQHKTIQQFVRDNINQDREIRDYEEYDVLKEHKIKLLQNQIEQAISRKYRISFAKGIRIFYEQCILFMLMLAILIKSNVYSLIYLMYVIRYMISTSKLYLLIRLVRAISLVMTIQYTLYVTNMISHLSPISMPEQFSDYPIVHHDEKYTGPYAIPVLYKYSYFKDLKFAYLIGLPVSKQQLVELIYDFMILFLVSTYVFLYQSPVLDPKVKKIFYCFPNDFDSNEKWSRVHHGQRKVEYVVKQLLSKENDEDQQGAKTDESKTDKNQVDDSKDLANKKPDKEVDDQETEDNVQSQIRWMRRPYLPSDEAFKLKGFSKAEIELAKKQFEFACDYSGFVNPLKQDQGIETDNNYTTGKEFHPERSYDANEDCDKDLNYQLVNYCELKYNEIWSMENIRARKWELKQQNFYFRLVKQGSVLIYLSSHIFVLFIILLMSTIRQSLVGFIYVFFIMFTFFRTKAYAGAVLTQRDQNQVKRYLVTKEQYEKKKDEYIKIEKELKELEGSKEQQELKSIEQKQKDKKKIQQKLKQSQQAREKLDELDQQMRQLKSLKIEKNAKDQAKNQWGMLGIFGTYLLIYSTLDFAASVIYQLPVFNSQPESYTPVEGKGDSMMKGLGLRKIWHLPKISNEFAFTYEGLVRASFAKHIKQFTFDGENFFALSITCFMITMVMFQVEIYRSTGYLKFVTQSDGSLDLLMNLAQMKKQSLAFTKNNHKIKKIISIQAKRKLILRTVEIVQNKIKRWRRFSSTTLDTAQASKPQIQERRQLSKLEAKEQQESQAEQQQSEQQNEEAEQELKDPESQAMIDYYHEMHKEKKSRVSRDDAEKIYEKLAHEFVQSKIPKLNRCSRCYLWLNSCCVKNIMLKNDEKQLREIVKAQATGEVETPCELERIMKIEAKHTVRKFFDKREGDEQLFLLLKKSQMQGFKKSILSMTKFDKKIKINHLENTWAFTRPASMLIKYIELFFYVLITNTHNFIYFFMMFSMYQNAGLMSIVYPISIFGYALIEESRPKKEYWDFIRVYTLIILFIKMIMNLSWLDDTLGSDTFMYYHGLLRIGLQNRKTTWSIIVYMLPETLIVTFTIFNEIMLRLNGVYEHHEGQYETVFDALERWKAKGDLDKQQEALVQQANMDMSKYFKSIQEQRDILLQIQIEKKKQLELEEESEIQLEPKEEEKPLSKIEMMDQLLAEYSDRIFESAYNFDLDSDQIGAAAKNSNFDKMVKGRLLLKGLENDSIYFVEGQTDLVCTQYDLIDPVEVREEMLNIQIDETVSDGEFEADMDQKIDLKICHKEKDKPGVFEKSPYLQSIFPSLQIQKPGYDYYGFTTMVLAILAIFVLYGFDTINTSQKDILKNAAGASDIFTTDTSVALFCNMILIILERYINRANVIQQEDKPLDKMDKVQGTEGGQSNAINMAQTQRTMTSSMTMSQTMKTMKTGDINAQMGDSKGLLDQLFQSTDEQEDEEISTQRSKINFKQKLKYTLHWFLIITVHIQIFWIIPVRGNLKLYPGKPYCDENNVALFPYGCKNFRASPFLIIFYFLFCCYFTLSALQLRYGLPIWKKASSLMQYMDYDSYSGQFGYIGAQVYMALPFAAELRCLFDFVFTKTALDVFQYWQLFNYQMEMYLAHFGNQSYVVKTMGVPVTFEDYLIGYIVLIIILIAIMGPLYFFSQFSSFSVNNPVIESQVSVAILINKTLSVQDLENRMVPSVKKEPEQQSSWQRSLGKGEETELFISDKNSDLYKKKNLNSSVPYKIFKNNHPFLKNITEVDKKNEIYDSWTETQFFKADQIQELFCTEYPDEKWSIDKLNRKYFKEDIINTFKHQKPGYKMQLQVKGKFLRNGPPQNLTASSKQFKELDFNNLDDCITGKQLEAFANFDCSLPENRKEGKSVLIPWTQAVNPYLILGQKGDAVPIIRKILEVPEEKMSNWLSSWKNNETLQNDTVIANDQKHDVLMEFRCPDRWLIRMSNKPTKYQDWEIENDLRRVDNRTCAIATKNETYIRYLESKHDLYGTLDADGNFKKSDSYKKRYEQHSNWGRLQFTLFSMFVSSSIFASYSVGAFYTVFLYGLAPMLRRTFLFGTWKGFVYEITDSTVMMRLFESCYMYRHEQDLYHEEESYRMIQEIVRSPGLLKLLTGSSLRGTLDPSLDNLKKDVKQKLQRLEQLEQKNFDVSSIREKILKEQEENIKEMIEEAKQDRAKQDKKKQN